MKKSIIFLFFSFIILSVYACERNSHQIGGKQTVNNESVVPGSSEAKEPAVYAMAKGAGISDVLPKDSSGEKKLDGKSLFMTNCSACHQASGQGIPGAFPPLVDSEYVVSSNVERLAAIMIYGLNGPIEVNGAEYNGVMAGLGAALNDKELSAIATFIRSEWGNDAGSVEPEVFSGVREKYGSRSLFTINEFEN